MSYFTVAQVYKDTYSNGVFINSDAPNSNSFIFLSAPNLNNSVTLVLPNNDGTADQILTTDGDGNLSWSEKNSQSFSTDQYFDAYDNTGGQALTDSPITLIFDTERQNANSTIFNLAAGIVSINITDKYFVMYRVGVDAVNGSSRSENLSFLEKNSGSGWVEVDGFRTHEYNRQDNRGFSTASANGIIDIESGDQLRVRVQRADGTDDLATIADGSSISIFAINNSGSGPPGPTGQDGADGAEGPKGDPGTASDFIGIYNSDDGGVTINSTAATIPYNSISNESNASGTIFSLSNTELVVSSTDDFMIQYTVTLEQVGGNNRTTWQTWLEQDDGGGFSEISGTRGSGYSRQTSDGENSSFGQTIVSVSGSSTFRVRAQDTGSNRDHEAIPNGCSMVVYTLRGGEQGPAGSSGTATSVAGVEGSGDTGQIAYWTGGSSSETITGESELFYNSSSNFLGVGVSSPSYSLDVADRINVGGEGSSGTFSYYSESGATDYSVNFFASNSMTESTNYRLPESQGELNTLLMNDGSGNLSWGTLSSATSSNQGVQGNGTGNQLAFWEGTGASETITSDAGLVYDSVSDFLGIGISSPSYNLDVASNVNIGQNGTSGTLSLYSENGGTDHEVIFTSSSTMTESTAYVMPGEQGANNSVLTNDGSGNLFWGNLSSAENIILGVNTDTQGAGTIDNYDIDEDSSLIRLNATGNITLNGIESDDVDDGQLFYLVNVGTGNIEIIEDSAPDADDGILTASGDITLQPNGTITMIYDATSGRWRVFSSF